eukprot:2403362-Heterocapsa_arctica.AAC.1
MTCHNCGSDQHLIRECNRPKSQPQTLLATDAPPTTVMLAPGCLGIAPLAPGQTSLFEAARLSQPCATWSRLDHHQQEQHETADGSSYDEHEQ